VVFDVSVYVDAMTSSLITSLVARVRSAFARAPQTEYVAPPRFDDAALSVARTTHHAFIPYRSMLRTDLAGHPLEPQRYYQPCSCGRDYVGFSHSQAERLFKEHQDEVAADIFRSRQFAELRDQLEPAL